MPASRRPGHGSWSSTSSAPWPGPPRPSASTRSSPATVTPSRTTCRRCGGAATSTAPSTSSSPAAATTTWPGSASGCWRCCARPTSIPASTSRSSTTWRAGRAARVLEAYDEVPGVLAELRDARPGPRHLLELGLGPRARDRRGRPRRALRHGGVVGVGGRAQAPPADLPLPARAGRGSIPTDVLFVGDTWGPDVEGPLAAGMRPAYLERRRALAGRDETGRDRPRSRWNAHPRPHRDPAAPRTGLRGCRPLHQGRREMRSDDADVLRLFTLAARADVELDALRPLPGCGNRCPGWPRSGRTRRARPHGR